MHMWTSAKSRVFYVENYFKQKTNNGDLGMDKLKTICF